MGSTMIASAAYDGYLNVVAGIDESDRTVRLATVSPSAAAERQGVLADGRPVARVLRRREHARSR